MPASPLNRIYVYCVTSAVDGDRFPVAGIGGIGDTPYAIAEKSSGAQNPDHGAGTLAAVASDVQDDVPNITKEILMSHQRVLEEVMKEHTVLPVAFGSVCNTPDVVRRFLRHNGDAIRDNLNHVVHRIELGLKVFWNLEAILKEVAEQDQEVLRLRRHPRLTSLPDQVEAGKTVEAALQRRKESYVDEIISHLANIAADHCLNEELTDEMVLNAAFLVDKNHEAHFDNAIGSLGERHKDHLQFLYSGPWPPYNFTHLALSSVNAPTAKEEENDAPDR
jgi:hypothetical protein